MRLADLLVLRIHWNKRHISPAMHEPASFPRPLCSVGQHTAPQPPGGGRPGAPSWLLLFLLGPPPALSASPLSKQEAIFPYSPGMRADLRIPQSLPFTIVLPLSLQSLGLSCVGCQLQQLGVPWPRGKRGAPGSRRQSCYCYPGRLMWTLADESGAPNPPGMKGF